ncbi:unnamed protein product [Ceutorhynchus assimilis]|uniref:Uncharacterized protein n=1 Tax=Ceutorhynchus assimilis TaxID=467358 RepID=A0A9N9MD95_9CUCU|nr:unnamed protein product [Ceutorhynchus assimilis]
MCEQSKVKLSVGFLFLFACFLTVICDEVSVEEDDESSRETREYMPEIWHAVQTIPGGATGWIPRDPVDGQVVTTKRRRLRKRKRRPPIVSYLDQSSDSVVAQIPQDFQQDIHQSKEASSTTENIKYETDNSEHTIIRRRKRPNAGDPWDELQEESVRPYIRRKVTPSYQTSEEPTILTREDFNPMRATIQFGPSANSDQDAEKYSEKGLDTDNEDISYVLTTTRKPPNLKEILKQNGGLSLSEILQKKNITLAELLTGKQEAIKALTVTSTGTIVSKSTTTALTPTADNFENPKYQRLPPSIALRKDTINRRYEQYGAFYDVLSDKEMEEAQRRRLALLQGHNSKGITNNGKFSEVTRFEVITEPITEKRIFVPSHPKLYTAVNYKPDWEDIITESYIQTDVPIAETTTPTTTTTTTTPKVANKLSKWGISKTKSNLPLTSAKLMKAITKKPAISSSTETVTVEEENYPKTSSVKPLKINLKDIFGFKNHDNQVEDKILDGPLRMSIDLESISDMSSSTTSTTTKPLTTKEIPKLRPFSAKDEILQVLNDPKGRAGLSRILEARNMTIQELIEQRERGSSQLHLADIFHNKTKEPEPSDDALEGNIISSELLTNFPVFARKPKVLLDKEDTTTTTSKPVEHNLSVTAYPSFKIEIKKEEYPWQRFYPELNGSQEKTTSKPDLSETSIMETADILTEEDIQRLEDLEQKLYSSASSEHLQIIDEHPQKVVNISSGVKSAIIASLVIFVLSMTVFVTILLIFRWSQRKKKTFNYHDSLKPPLFNEKTRNIKTFVAETLGKKKVNYYKRHLQSMSDDSWEDDRKNVF